MLRIDLPSTLITFLLSFLGRPFYRAAFNPQTAEFVPYRSGRGSPAATCQRPTLPPSKTCRRFAAQSAKAK
jgi:hypothetical protein